MSRPLTEAEKRGGFKDGIAWNFDYPSSNWGITKRELPNVEKAPINLKKDEKFVVELSFVVFVTELKGKTFVPIGRL